MDLILVDLVLVDWENWRNGWETDWRIAREERRRGELVRLLGFLATTHSGLNTIYYGTADRRWGMIHERWKEYKLSNTITKVEQRTKEWHHGPSEPCS